MKPFSAKIRKENQDPMQMDFLANIPEPTLPMKPIEPSPDGTPPLPLLNQRPPLPPRPAFHFESDPFFKQQKPAPQAPPEPAPEEADVPATAEERLLETIVQAPEAEAPAPVPLICAAELNSLRAELELALEEAKKSESSRQKAQQDLVVMKTRFAALDAELSAARLEANQQLQARTQIETRFAEAEKQWTEKLSSLRRMLDEVEDTRDEVYQKRVPKLLFVGTLIAGILAAIFAYLIGVGQAASRTAPPDVSPPPPAAAPIEPPPLRPLTPEPPPPMIPPAAPLLVPESPALSPLPEPATPEKPAPPPAPVTPSPKKPLQPAPGKTTEWPSLTGGQWSPSKTTREMKIVFHYGIFTRNTEFSDDARQDLKAIASALKGKPFLIEVVGHTDATKLKKGKSSGSSNKTLGMARAKAVAAYLTGACGLPPGMITTSSAGENSPPYPNTTAANQQKNRTVTLRITPR